MNSGRIGIDLGISFCCCGVYKSHRVEIIPYNDGLKTIPSYVFYSPNTSEIDAGNVAGRILRYAEQIVFDSKRFIGRRFADPEVQQDITHWPFKMIKGDNGQPLVELKHNGRIIRLTAKDISSELLKKIKKTADEYYGQDPSKQTEAVITVPAYFNNQQRQETIEAAEKANLKVINIINEPTAAAVAYVYQQMQQGVHMENEKVLVFDFGGGKFDVSIIKINHRNKKIAVLGSDGDCHLGGEEIDQNLAEYFHQKYKEKKGREMNCKQRFKLMKACESAKLILNCEGKNEAVVDCETLEDADIDCILTRSEFEGINNEIFDKTMSVVDNVLSVSRLSPRDINSIILVGGSSRIPKVQELLRHKFPKSTICKDINPDEVVAYGACLYANLEDMYFEVQDIITHTISTDIEEGGRTVLYPLIKKNTPIPYISERPICFANFEDDADHIDISVFEGEGRYPTDRGIRELRSVPFRIPVRNVRAREYIIETRYKVDRNGILTIEVTDRQTGDITTLHIELHIELE